MNFPQTTNTGPGLALHDHLAVPIRANTEHAVCFMTPTHSSILPKESLVQRMFHIYSQVESQFERENPQKFLHMFDTSNKSELNSINLADDDVSTPDDQQTAPKIRPTSLSQLTNILSGSAQKHQQVEHQLRELFIQFLRSTGDLSYLLDRLLERKYVLKRSPIDLLSDTTDNQQSPHHHQHHKQPQDDPNDPNGGRQSSVWITPFLPNATASPTEQPQSQALHYSEYSTGSTSHNQQESPAATTSATTIKSIISPLGSLPTEKEYQLAILRIMIIKRKIQLNKSNRSLQFFTRRSEASLRQSTQLFHDLHHISTHFPISLPFYLSNTTAINSSNSAQQQPGPRPATTTTNRSAPITHKVYSASLSNPIINGYHAQHLASFLSPTPPSTLSTKPLPAHSINPLHALFVRGHNIQPSGYDFASRLLSDSMRAKALTNSIFFTKNILMQNTTLFVHLPAIDQQYSSIPHQIMQLFYKSAIAHDLNPIQSDSNQLQAAHSSLRQLIVQFDPQVAQNMVFKQPSPIFHTKQYSRKTHIARDDDTGLIFTQTQPLDSIRLALRKVYRAADSSTALSPATNDRDVEEKVSSQPNSFAQTMNDASDLQHWKRVLSGLHRLHQQTITQSLLHRLVLEANVLENGNSTNYSNLNASTSADYAVNIDKDRLLTKQVDDKMNALRIDYEQNRASLESQLNAIRERKGKFDDELNSFQQQSQQPSQQQPPQQSQQQPQQQQAQQQPPQQDQDQQQQQSKPRSKDQSGSKETTLASEEKALEDKLTQLRQAFDSETQLLQLKLTDLRELQVAPPTLGSTYSTQWSLLPDVLIKNELDSVDIRFRSHCFGLEHLSPNNPFNYPLTLPTSSLSPLPDAAASQHMADINTSTTSSMATTNIHQGLKIFITGQSTFLEEQMEQFSTSAHHSQLTTTSPIPIPTPPLHLPNPLHPQQSLINNTSRTFLLLHYLFFLQYSQTLTTIDSLPLMHKLNIPFYPQFYLRTPNLVQIRLDDPSSSTAPQLQHQSTTAPKGYPYQQAGQYGAGAGSSGVQRDPLSPSQLKEQELLHDSLSTQYLLFQQTRQQTQQSYFRTLFSHTSHQHSSNAPSVFTTIPLPSPFPSSHLNPQPQYQSLLPNVLPLQCLQTTNSMVGLSSPNSATLQSFPHSLLQMLTLSMKDISNSQSIRNKVKSLRANVLLPWNRSQRAMPTPQNPSSTSPSTLPIPTSASTNFHPTLSNPFSARKLPPRSKRPTPNPPQNQTPPPTSNKPKVYITFSESSSSLPLRSQTSPQPSSTHAMQRPPQDSLASRSTHAYYSLQLNATIVFPSGTTSTVTLCTVACVHGLIVLKTYNPALQLASEASSGPSSQSNVLTSFHQVSANQEVVLQNTVTCLQLFSILHDSIKQLMAFTKAF